VRARGWTDVLPGQRNAVPHRGMKVSESDWNVFLGHAAATPAKFKLPESEQRDPDSYIQRETPSEPLPRFRLQS
jgi:hypothetical protein